MTSSGIKSTSAERSDGLVKAVEAMAEDTIKFLWNHLMDGTALWGVRQLLHGEYNGKLLRVGNWTPGHSRWLLTKDDLWAAMKNGRRRN